jgi:hypothetical protein
MANFFRARDAYYNLDYLISAVPNGDGPYVMTMDRGDPVILSAEDGARLRDRLEPLCEPPTSGDGPDRPPSGTLAIRPLDPATLAEPVTDAS